MQDSTTDSINSIRHDSAASNDYRDIARERGIDLDFVKRHRFTESWKATIFEHFDQARATVRGKQEALVVVEGNVRGALALSRETIGLLFSDLLPVFDALVEVKNAAGNSFDPERDVIILFAKDPFPQYFGKEVRGFRVWKVAGTCHFRQFPLPEDPKAELKAFGSFREAA